MKISDIIVMTVQNLLRRKVRTLLTVIGVVVGTCSIVVMVSLGVGMDRSLQATLENMGDLTIIDIYSYGKAAGSEDQVKLDDKAIKTIQEMDGVVVASPYWRPWDLDCKVKDTKKERYKMEYVNIVGVYPEAIEAFGYDFKEGKTLPSTHDKDKVIVVLGEETAYEFEDTKRKYDNYIWPEQDENGEYLKDPFVDMIHDDITLYLEPQDEDEKDKKTLEYEMQACGIVKGDRKKSYESLRGIFMDIDQLKEIQKEYNKINGIKTSNKKDDTYESVKVKVEDISLVEPIQNAIKEMGFETSSMEDIRKPMEQQAKQQQVILGGLGGISLFVAALGITNTMIMSIYERTREIGIMKVLGCNVDNIRSIFLGEAGLIGFFGGVIGVVISFGISYLLNTVNMNIMGDSFGGMGYMMGGMGEEAIPISIIPWQLVVGALVFATFIGLVSGFYPANRAVKISALEAIKHD